MIGALATEALLSPVAGAVLGIYLNKWFDMAPWGMFIGLFIGLGGMVKVGLRLYKLAKQDMQGGQPK